MLIVFTTGYCIYIAWQCMVWLSLKKHHASSNNLITKVTVIIPCRNEESNITSCLHSVLNQDYPNSLLEIIVVDDHSEDKTASIAKQVLSASNTNWKVLTLGHDITNKKHAIEAAIKESSGELIITTDADCTSGKGWISSIVSLYEKEHFQMICGPVAITGDDTFCKSFQALELSGLSILAGAGIASRSPLLCNGANLAYTHRAFTAVNGFSGNDDMPTGDDTLLLYKINKQLKNSIGFIKSDCAIVYTQAQPNWGSLLQQRLRWASKGFRSNNMLNSVISALVFITNLLLLVSITDCFVYFPVNMVAILCIIAKFTSDFFLLTCGTSFFKRHKLLWYFLLSELVTVFYVSLVGIGANFSSYKWKGREYRTKT